MGRIKESYKTISVNNSKSRVGLISIYSNNPFFRTEELIVKVELDCIVITKPDLDYKGKIQKPSYKDSGAHFEIKADAPAGKYLIDEEDSTEDKLIIYFEDYER